MRLFFRLLLCLHLYAVEALAENAGESPEADGKAQEAGGSDDLLADILGQNVGSGDGEDSEDEEMESVRIKPEELDDAVARGVQEVDEAVYAARVADAQAHAHDGEGEPEIDDEPQSAEPQEPRFVYGMQSVSECFEVVDERSLYPDRPEEELDKHEPNELEDITTMVVVTEKVTEQKTVSPEVKEFCVELARAHELKRVYFFGGLGLDNDEFLFGFGKFAMYRNVVYAALASDEGGLSKEIKNFGEIAELQSPVTPFQNAAAPNALELEKPFKIYIQDSLGSAAGEPAVAAAPTIEAEPTVEEPTVDLSQAQETAAPEVEAEPTVADEPAVEAGPRVIPGQGLMEKALWILNND